MHPEPDEFGPGPDSPGIIKIEDPNGGRLLVFIQYAPEQSRALLDGSACLRLTMRRSASGSLADALVNFRKRVQPAA